MQVDETRRDEVAGCVDFLPALAFYATYGSDEAFIDGEIARNRFGPGSVNDMSASNHDVMCHALLQGIPGSNRSSAAYQA